MLKTLLRRIVRTSSPATAPAAPLPHIAAIVDNGAARIHGIVARQVDATVLRAASAGPLRPLLSGYIAALAAHFSGADTSDAGRGLALWMAMAAAQQTVGRDAVLFAADGASRQDDGAVARGAAAALEDIARLQRHAAPVGLRDACHALGRGAHAGAGVPLH